MTESNTTTEKKKIVSRRRLQGVVVSAAMTKTVVIQIDRRIAHEKYGKFFTISRKFKVHDEHGKAKRGDVIVIEETRPISKDKRWRYIKTIKSAI
jgi:small subunit ribosomal protein S17